MIALAYAIPLGVFSGWSGVLDWILTPAHISQVGAHVCVCISLWFADKSLVS